MKFKTKIECYSYLIFILNTIQADLKYKTNEIAQLELTECAKQLKILFENHESNPNRACDLLDKLIAKNVLEQKDIHLLTQLKKNCAENDFYTLSTEERFKNPLGRRFESEFACMLLHHPTNNMMNAVKRISQEMMKLLDQFDEDKKKEWVSICLETQDPQDAFGAFKKNECDFDSLRKILMDNNPEQLLEIMQLHYKFARYLVRDEEIQHDEHREPVGKLAEIIKQKWTGDPAHFFTDGMKDDSDKSKDNRSFIANEIFCSSPLYKGGDGKRGRGTFYGKYTQQEGLMLVDQDSVDLPTHSSHWYADCQSQKPNLKSAYVWDAVLNDTVYVSGPSGMTALRLNQMEILGNFPSVELKQEYLAAVAAYIMSGGLHSLHEIIGPAEYSLSLLPGYDVHVPGEKDAPKPPTFHTFFDRLSKIDDQFTEKMDHIWQKYMNYFAMSYLPEQAHLLTENVSRSLLDVSKNEWAAAEDYFKQHPDESKWKGQAVGQGHRFIKIDNVVLAMQKENLGKGEFGKVKIVQNSSGENFALKVQKRVDSEKLATEKEALKRQDKLLGELRRVSPSGYKEYLLMPLNKGKNLKDYMEYVNPYTMSLQERLLVALKFCRSLENLHELGIVHKDLHDRNVMLQGGHDPNVELIDFGEAAIVKDINIVGSLSWKWAVQDIYCLSCCLNMLKLPAEISKYLFAGEASNIDEKKLPLTTAPTLLYVTAAIIRHLEDELVPSKAKNIYDYVQESKQELSLFTAEVMGKNDFTTLYYAIVAGDQETVKKLIEKEGKNLQEKYRISPLVLAVIMGSKNIVELLLQKGIVDDIRFNEKYAFELAERNHEVEMMKLLLAHYRPEKDSSGLIAQAYLEKAKTISKEFLSAVINKVNMDKIPLEQMHSLISLYIKDVNAIKLIDLLKKEDLQKIGSTLLFQAMAENNEDLTIHLLSLGIDVAHQNEDGNNILHLALAKKDMAIVDELLNDYPELATVKNKKGLLPLDLAIESQLPNAVERIIGLELQKNNDENKCLTKVIDYWLVEEKNIEMIKNLYERFPTFQGAILKKLEDIFISHRSDVDFLSVWKKVEETFKLDSQLYTDVLFMLSRATFKQKYPCFLKLLEIAPHLNVNVSDFDGDTPLIWAIKKIDHEDESLLFCKKLIELGAIVSSSARDGQMPLDIINECLKNTSPRFPKACDHLNQIKKIVETLLVEEAQLKNKIADFIREENFDAIKQLYDQGKSQPFIMKVLGDHFIDQLSGSNTHFLPSWKKISELFKFSPTFYDNALLDLSVLSHPQRYNFLIRLLEIIPQINVNAKDAEGNSALINAIKHVDQHEESFLFCKKIIELGANLAEPNDQGETPLSVIHECLNQTNPKHQAITYSHLNEVKEILSKRLGIEAHHLNSEHSIHLSKHPSSIFHHESASLISQTKLSKEKKEEHSMNKNKKQ